MAAAIASFTGVSDFTVRLPSIVGAALLVWLTYFVGTLGTKRQTALLAVDILASTFQFWNSCTEARVDMVFASLVAGSLAGWYWWYHSGRKVARGAAYLSVALAVLAKGPAGGASWVSHNCFSPIQARHWRARQVFFMALDIVGSYSRSRLVLGRLSARWRRFLA
jgi:Dolichyl-phosphate-mannose-protein mannosyltransferase